MPMTSSLQQGYSCFFCDEESPSHELREARTFGLDSRVRNAALSLEDTQLLGKLSQGDMIAIEAKYHLKCVSSLYNRARSKREQGTDDGNSTVNGIVFAELITYIEETLMEETTIPVFKLSDLVKLYNTRCQQLYNEEQNVHSTRLKNKLLAYIPGFSAYKKGREMLITFDEGIGKVLSDACEINNDSDALCLTRAAQIVRRDLFQKSSNFIGTFQKDCQKNSVPQSLLALIRMILDGSNITKQSTTPEHQAAVSIAQLLKFNSVVNQRQKENIRHRLNQETPLPIYVGVLLHIVSRKKQLIDKLFELRLSISYDRVLRLSADLGNTLCERFQESKVVCPSNMLGNVFTTAAVDNIDHNLSSTTAQESFHGTGISLFQHPSEGEDGIDLGVLRIVETSTNKVVKALPSFYTDVQPVAMKLTELTVPEGICTLQIDEITYFNDAMAKEKLWLQKVYEFLEKDIIKDGEWISWAAYHANCQEKQSKIQRCTSALLPLFQDQAHSAAMLPHSMDVIRQAVDHLNHGQTPIVACDQPLFAICKEIQWTFPETYGENHFIIMFGALHIEMAALKTAGHWLQGSGWSDVLVNAGVATSGIADSLINASHVTRTRYAHQVTVASLNILLHKAYNKYLEVSGESADDFDEWSKNSCNKSPHFHYWYLTMELELTICIFIRSIREGNFSLYVEALRQLVPWFFAMDCTHYSRWIPVHIKDMLELHLGHPNVAEAFHGGKFVVHKTHRVFSGIAIDQAHEQANKKVKGDGGVIGLTQDPVALCRWMIAGPEMARLVEEFENDMTERKPTTTLHHDQSANVQIRFQKHVRAMVQVIDGLGNPFEETSNELFMLTTKDNAHPSVANTVRRVKTLGTEQYQMFVRDRLRNRSTPITNVIQKNKLVLFHTNPERKVGDDKAKLTAAKNDAQLFSKLYIACQNREGGLDNFFAHENQSEPPSLAGAGRMRACVKSDILQCISNDDCKVSDRPDATALILDGAVIVQMLKPGTAKTFSDYCQLTFIPYIVSQLTNVQRIDLVWDDYRTDSLKGSTREKRGKGVRRRVTPNSPVPKNWQSFLRDDNNKQELFAYLTHEVGNITVNNKIIVVTDGQGVKYSTNREDLSTLQPCSHEEADSRIFVHAADALKMGHKKIMIRTTDSDVVVLAVSFFVMCTNAVQQCEMWIAYGVGKHYCYLSVNNTATLIGSEKAAALPFFHAFTGCDTVSSFAGRGKRTAWDVWRMFPEVTEVFRALTMKPLEVTPESLVVLERFVVLMYDRTSTSTSVNETRKHLFSKKNRSIEGIPPTQAALLQHTKRAAYQGGHIWGQINVPMPLYPNISDWGWVKRDDKYQPLWTILPEAADACYELLHCGCKVACTKRCKCVQASLRCTSLCQCDGACEPIDM